MAAPKVVVPGGLWPRFASPKGAPGGGLQAPLCTGDCCPRQSSGAARREKIQFHSDERAPFVLLLRLACLSGPPIIITITIIDA